MLNNKTFSLGLLLFLIGGAIIFLMKPDNTSSESAPEPKYPKHLVGIDPDKVDWRAKDDAYWKESLDPAQYAICRHGGTEQPFSGNYCKSKADGAYICSCCGQELFSSDNKFDSGTGWPSFSEAAKEGALEYVDDSSHGMLRTEVRCSRCGAHLGHVFDDGPKPSGKRFCINSVCLFRKSE